VTTDDPRATESGEDESVDAEGPDQHAALLAELGLMTASLLHELRDPLFALRAQVQLLRLKGQGQELSGLQRPLDDIDALLDFYGGFSRRGTDPLPTDLGQELRAAADVIRTQARRRRTALEVVPGSESLIVRVRPVSVRQVLMNLVNNALDAVAEVRGPAVRVRAERRDIDGQAHGVIIVEDNGPGWPAETLHRARLLEPWVTTKGSRGSGLGLYLTRSLLAEAGGELRLEDVDEGSGARASACWPLSGA